MNLSEQFQHLLGERIKAKRRDLHFTQMELSERLSISRAMLANIETGGQRTSAFLLARLAQTLECPVEDLVPRMAEAEERLRQSQQVSLTAATRPERLTRALEAYGISVDSASTLDNALAEVQRRGDESQAPKPKEAQNG